MKILTYPASATTFVTLLTSCSDTPQTTEKKAAEPAKPAEPVAGKYALYQMYTAARGSMGADIEPVQFKSLRLARRESRARQVRRLAGNICFRARLERPAAIHIRSSSPRATCTRGLRRTGGKLVGRRRGPKPFPMAAVKTDTDAAYETAKKKAVEYEKRIRTSPSPSCWRRRKNFPIRHGA